MPGSVLRLNSALRRAPSRVNQNGLQCDLSVTAVWGGRFAEPGRTIRRCEYRERQRA